MAKKPKNEKNTVDVDLLRKIVEAGGEGMFINPIETEVLFKLDLVEINKDFVNPANNAEIATRATQAGIDYLENLGDTKPTSSEVAQVETEKVNKTMFELETVTEIPKAKRRGRAGSTLFPIDDMAAPATNDKGQSVFVSFHVPVTEDRKEPWKSLASMVSNANAKYSEKTGEVVKVKMPVYEKDAEGKRVKQDGKFVKIGEEWVDKEKTRQLREYVIKQVDATDPKGPGARIYRVM